MYNEIGLAFIATGVIMLLIPVSKIHPDFFNPKPLAMIRTYGIGVVMFGLVAVYTLVRLAKKVIVVFDGQKIYYPRGGYVVPLAGILRAKCYFQLISERKSGSVNSVMAEKT